MNCNAFGATTRVPQLAVVLAFLLWGGASFAGGASELDGDGIPDTQDNCLINPNSAQDDTDNDFCGNLCDCDYDQNGICGLSDFGQFAQAFMGNDEEKCHVQPIPGCTVGLDDFGFFAQHFNQAPGPSGTTPGTIACPLR